MRQQAALQESVAFEHELALSVEAQRAVRVMMRKSPETQRTYTGIYDRFAGWLADRQAVRQVPVSSFTSEAFVTYLERLEERCSTAIRLTRSSARASCAMRSPSSPATRTLFAQLGRRRRDGSFPDAGGQLSTTALIRIVRPIMLAAGVPVEQAHPHTLRHTFGRLYMAAPRAELSRLQRIMGHASPETTSRYMHDDDHELAAEHRRIERLRHDPLARRQQRRRELAAMRES